MISCFDGLLPLVQRVVILSVVHIDWGKAVEVLDCGGLPRVLPTSATLMSPLLARVGVFIPPQKVKTGSCYE